MNKMKLIILYIITVVLTLSISSCEAQIPNAKTVEVNVYGNCGMCRKTIERAGNKKNKARVEWNSETKKATITYNAKRTSVDKILKRIANAGYDNETYHAPDDVYNELHGCCQYKRKPKKKL